MPDYQTILVERTDGVATVTMNRPGQRNGMTNRMVREMHEALLSIAADSSVRILVLTGAGEQGFCPGADINWALSEERKSEAEPLEGFHFQVPALLHEMPAVTIAAINGAVAGAGFGWACGADVRVAKRSAVFRTAFLNVGFAGDMGIPWSLPRLIGGARARELSLFPTKFNATEAYEYGLVTRVFEDAMFRAEVQRMIQELLGRAPLALRALKQHYVAAERMSFPDYLDLETAHHRQIGATEDTREGFRAFLEKRKPAFQGR